MVGKGFSASYIAIDTQESKEFSEIDDDEDENEEEGEKREDFRRRRR